MAVGYFIIAILGCADGSTQCDCAEWFYREDAPTAPDLCKHLAALAALGWI